MARFKKYIIILIVLIISIIGTIWYSNDVITKRSEGRTFSEAEDVPAMKVGLLLGTAKQLKNGYTNLYFKYRIDATTRLFQAGKIKYVIISGDNSRSTYDEPTDMKNELIKNGIDSTKIYLDYAGFRTFDSMVRVREIFSQDSVVIISQKFHNERAIYIADKSNLYAVGYNAKDVSNKYGFKTAVREKFARVKVILDFIIGTKPKFLGEKIEIK